MRSMTGYGRGLCERDGRSVAIELKSVNHRFLDLSFRMPRSFAFAEDAMRRQIASGVSRGHLDIYVSYSNIRDDSKTVRVDTALLSAYMKAMDLLDGLPDDRTRLSVAQLDGVMTVEEAAEDSEALTVIITEALSSALGELNAMRLREGGNIKTQLSNSIDELERVTDTISERYPQTVKEYTERLKKSVRELIDRDIDEARLLTEVAIMADRSAIDEEVVRLHSHIAQLRQLLADEEPVGRRVDFLVQELNREVNTISSKSQDVPITNLVIEAKAIIEKLREQIQNIE